MRGWEPNDHFVALLIAGLFYYPMALLAVAIYGSLSVALNAVLVLRSLLRIPFQYVLACVARVVASEIRSLVTGILAPSMAILAGAVADYLGFYFMMVTMRMLGVMYRVNDAPDWTRGCRGGGAVLCLRCGVTAGA